MGGNDGGRQAGLLGVGQAARAEAATRGSRALTSHAEAGRGDRGGHPAVDPSEPLMGGSSDFNAALSYLLWGDEGEVPLSEIAPTEGLVRRVRRRLQHLRAQEWRRAVRQCKEEELDEVINLISDSDSEGDDWSRRGEWGGSSPGWSFTPGDPDPDEGAPEVKDEPENLLAEEG